MIKSSNHLKRLVTQIVTLPGELICGMVVTLYGCVSKPTLMMIDLIEAKAASMVLSSINNAYRKKILNLINDFPGITVKELYEGLYWEESVVSQHLGCLRRSGLVRTEGTGKFIHYYAHLENINVMRLLVQQLATYFNGVDSRKLKSVV